VSPGRPSVDVADLTKTYPGAPAPSVDRVSFPVTAGRVFALLGANGAGKTTIIKMICGLVIPTGGAVYVEGEDVQRHRRRAMARMGVVLEGTRNLYWRLTAWENLLYFGRLRGWWGRRLKTRAEFLLRELGLWDRRHQTVQKFSRGMQQQVAIAAAVIADPSIVILDEPTLGLDAEATRRVKRWIATMTRDRGKTVILTTHQLDMAQDLSDDVAIMSRGKLVACRPMSELLDMARVGAYRIRVKGTIATAGREWLDGWDLAEDNGDTVLVGHVTGDTELYGVLEQLRLQRAPLVEVTPVEPDLEDIYLRLVRPDLVAAS
jgi:ABC-2 type transport system ATP-binding protein